MKKDFLAQYREMLLARGQFTFTKEEALKELRLSPSSFLQAAERLQKKRHLAKPKQGFYIVVPPEYVPWKAPPAEWYIHPLMGYLSIPYYVGILTAGTYHGATHHGVMRFQVVIDRYLPSMQVGRSAIDFHCRRNIDAVGMGISSQKVQTGIMRISAPELAALDMVRYPAASGGLDNVATALSDLAPNMDKITLARLCEVSERPTIQKLGFLLDWLDRGDLAEMMHADLVGRGQFPWIELERFRPQKIAQPQPPQEKNRRWRVNARRLPELEK